MWRQVDGSVASAYVVEVGRDFLRGLGESAPGRPPHARPVLGRLRRGARPRPSRTPACGATADGTRGETAPLPAPDGSGCLVVALDLQNHEFAVETSAKGGRRITLAPNHPVGAVAREALDAIRQLTEPGQHGSETQEVPWSVHSTRTISSPTTTPGRSPHIPQQRPGRAGAGRVPAPRIVDARPRSTHSRDQFDLAVSLFFRSAAVATLEGLRMRDAMDSQEIAVGWSPERSQVRQGETFYAYAHPAPEEFAAATLAPAPAHSNATLGEYILNWDDIRSTPRPAVSRPGIRPVGLPPRLHGV